MSQPTMLSSELQLAIAPGPLGIGIYRNEADGSCVVSRKNTQQSPFEVGDIILRLNGVSLRGVEGGVQGWVALFQRYANLQRNVVVRRWAPASGATVAATPSSARVAPQQNAASTTHQVTANVNQQHTMARAPSVPKTQQVANNNNMIQRETVTVFKPTQESKLGIGLVGRAGCIKVSSISPGYLFSTTRLKVGMIVESINTVQCTDAAHGVRLLKAAERQVTIVALHTEKTKKALKPSTYQNNKAMTTSSSSCAPSSAPIVAPQQKLAPTTHHYQHQVIADVNKLLPSTYQDAKKRKAGLSKPKKATNKKQAVSKTKTAAVPKSDNKHLKPKKATNKKQAVSKTKTAAVPKSYKKYLHLWIWLRESPKDEVIMLFDGWVSQLIRVVSAAILYAQENDLRLIIRGVVYAEMVDRRNVHTSDAWGAFLNQLLDFNEFERNKVTPGDVMMVMATELLRFGSNPYAVQEMIKVIEGMEINGVKCRVFTLKEAYLDQNTALMAWKKLEDNLAQLSQDIGSQRNPAKQVPVDEKKEADRNVLKVRAAEIESYVRVNKALPKDVYDLIEFVHPTKTPSDHLENLRKNFVKAQDVMAGRKESSMSSMKHVKEVISSQNVDNAFSSLKMCVYRGTNFLPKSEQDALIFCAAMFFRTSPSTISSTVCIKIKDDGSGSVLCVPLHQTCVNIARLLKYHEEQRGDQQGGKIQVTIYYDEMKSRDNGCNPQFASFVDGIYKNNFDLAMASRSNRCSSHLTSYYLLNKTCESTDTDLVFSEQYGQDDEKVAIAENERRFRQWEINTEFQAEMNVERNKLAQSVREESLVFLSLGWKQYSKDEKKLVKSILTSNGYNVYAELIDECDDVEKDSASNDDMKPAAAPTSNRSSCPDI